MSLTDIMSNAGLSSYAVVALVLFFGVFIAITGWVFWPSHKTWWRHAASLPLDDRTTITTETL